MYTFIFNQFAQSCCAGNLGIDIAYDFIKNPLPLRGRVEQNQLKYYIAFTPFFQCWICEFYCYGIF